MAHRFCVTRSLQKRLSSVWNGVCMLRIKEIILLTTKPYAESMWVVQIASALEGDATLVSLDVGCNNIAAQGITALAEALKGNENLKSLELGYNPIHEKGAQALADVVKYDLKVLPLMCHSSPPLLTHASHLKLLDLSASRAGGDHGCISRRAG